MGQLFYRRVEGFNYPFLITGSASLAQNAWLTISAPAGPGRLEAVFLMMADVTEDNPMENNVKLIVDGDTIFSGRGYYFWQLYNTPTFAGPIASRATSANYTILQKREYIDYANSASIGFQNRFSPDPCVFYAAIQGRKGY